MKHEPEMMHQRLLGMAQQKRIFIKGLMALRQKRPETEMKIHNLDAEVLEQATEAYAILLERKKNAARDTPDKG